MDTALKLLIASGALLFCLGGLWSARSALLIQLREERAQGRIVKTRFTRRQGSDADREAHVLIAFEVAGQTISFEQSAPGGAFTTHRAQSVQRLKGTPVTVSYDRKNPKRASITPRRDGLWGLLFACAGLGIFLAITLGWNEITF
ncbi:DUF3592 domain-containing protein [Alphaproteobacteria bacterium KMM 3653]|uniref:DUF3592 domain-containing protein n=1 Tax=Harenicola maris TaxID=2841044 RepID=A0AAP2CS40_9RHOB|nr:DUF3592 domain-containing protein [Harenicola maris]